MNSDPKTGERQIQLIGRGTPTYPTVDIACDGRRLTILLNQSEAMSGKAMPTYAVPENTAEMMIHAVECRLVLPTQEIALPRQQIFTAWARPSASGRPPKILQGQVIEVIDGDTIRINLQGRIETVRYIGIDAPETHHPTKGSEPGGREATEANRQLVAGQPVRLELDAQERDRNERLLAYVYVRDQMVNAELVQRGFAQATTTPTNIRHQEL